MSITSYSVVITSRADNFASPVFDRVVARFNLQETIELALNEINAEYPLTYADEITALIDYNDKGLGYRIDTINERKEIDSHYIHVAKIG